MAHPTKTQRRSGHLWHLEDSKLKRCDATALRNHLRRTEEKRARVSQTSKGYEVWWAKK